MIVKLFKTDKFYSFMTCDTDNKCSDFCNVIMPTPIKVTKGANFITYQNDFGYFLTFSRLKFSKLIEVDSFGNPIFSEDI